jgi:hypothetical protein
MGVAYSFLRNIRDEQANETVLDDIVARTLEHWRIQSQDNAAQLLQGSGKDSNQKRFAGWVAKDCKVSNDRELRGLVVQMAKENRVPDVLASRCRSGVARPRKAVVASIDAQTGPMATNTTMGNRGCPLVPAGYAKGAGRRIKGGVNLGATPEKVDRLDYHWNQGSSWIKNEFMGWTPPGSEKKVACWMKTYGCAVCAVLYVQGRIPTKENIMSLLTEKGADMNWRVAGYGDERPAQTAQDGSIAKMASKQDPGRANKQDPGPANEEHFHFVAIEAVNRDESGNIVSFDIFNPDGGKHEKGVPVKDILRVHNKP